MLAFRPRDRADASHRSHAFGPHAFRKQARSQRASSAVRVADRRTDRTFNQQMVRPFKKIAELVAEAESAQSDDACELLLTAAAAQATSAGEWKEILENLPQTAPHALKRKLVDRAIACARAREEVWGFRRAAIAEARALRDPEAARATLRAAEDVLTTRAQQGRALGVEWAILAGAFSEALADRAQVLRTLNAGWDFAWAARDVENLGRVVNQWAGLVDKAEAVERLGRVEEAAAGWGNLGGVIYWWRALGDAEAVRRTRERTLATTRSFEEVLRLVRSWNLYEEGSPGTEAAIARAEVLASTASEWFELAQAVVREATPEDTARRALDRAADLATDSALKVRIASAYVSWFRDEAAADRLGPRGVRPNDLRPRAAALAGWQPSASALFDWLCSRISPENLSRIAEADYGDDRDDHLAALEYMCETRLVPFVLPWCPHEVLALTRWGTHEVNHVERALACTLLLLASLEDEIINTGPILIDSCLALGEEAAALGVQLFAWRYETTDVDASDAPLTMLLLVMLRAAYHPDDPRIGDLIRQLVQSPDAPSLRQWMAESLRPELWSRLAQTILPKLRQIQPALSPELDTL